MSDDRDDQEGSTDPFERLGPDVDREGDPFERLDVDDQPAGTDDATTGAAGADAGSDDQPADDPWDPLGADRRDAAGGEDGSGVTPADATPSPDDPFADVETPAGSPFDDAGPGVFETVDVGGADPDEVWNAIVEDDGDEATPSAPTEDRYSEVSKHRFCERCEYFSEPPEVSCTHETAEIIEFLDVETVRLLDCPVVAEHEAFERGDYSSH